MLSMHLEDLHNCLERRLITEAEYQEQRRHLLGSFSASSLAAGAQAVLADGTSAQIADDAAHSGAPAATDSHLPQPSAAAGVDEGHGFDDTGQFWCSLIRDSSRKPGLSPSHHHSEMTMAALQVYDITAGRVHELFTEFDVDGDGFVSSSELVDGLRQLDLQISLADVECVVKHMMKEGLMDRRLPQQPVALTEKEFKLLLTMLRLAELFTPSAGVFQYKAYSSERFACPTHVCDYNRQHCRVSRLSLGAGEDVLAAQRYFFSRRKRWSLDSERLLGPRGTPARKRCYRDVRWVHVDGANGLDRLTLLRLAVKYGLHPLAVDDIIDNRTPTKLDVFQDYYFVSVDVLTLAVPEDDWEDSSNSTPSGEDAAPKRVRIHRSNVSMFLSRPPHYDTLITILQSRSDESSWMAMWRAPHTVPMVRDYSWWSHLRDTLAQDRQQRIRERRADFLLYEILDRIVGQLRPIAEAYARRLGYIHRHPPWQISQAWLDELDEVQLELRDLARSIRPMRQVLRHFISDGHFRAGVPRLYLEDIEDAIDQMLEDIIQLQEMGKTLEEAHEAHRDKKMNTTLYVLSVISAIFLPAQFVTGLYGMNFVDEDGHPTIPELLWPNGYLYFWLLELCLVLVGFVGAWLLTYSSLDFCSAQRAWCCPHSLRHVLCVPCRRRYKRSGTKS